jgi:DNA polymerase III epsilon subunit-like protein
LLEHHKFEDQAQLARNWSFCYAPPAVQGSKKLKAIVIDCEMGGSCFERSELILICVSEFFTGEVILHSYVKPSVPVKNWRTEWSGVTDDNIRKAIATGQYLDGWQDARARLFEWVDVNTIIMGHAVHNDLQQLRLCHERVIDTSLLIPRLQGKRHSLKGLSADILKQEIQLGGKEGHNCLEDTMSARELVVWCLRNPEAFIERIKQATIERKQASDERKKREAETLKAEAETLKAKNEDLNKQLAEAVGGIEVARSRANVGTDMEKRLESLMQDKARLVAQNRSLLIQNKELIGRNTELEGQNRELKGRFQEYHQDLKGQFDRFKLMNPDLNTDFARFKELIELRAVRLGQIQAATGIAITKTPKAPEIKPEHQATTTNMEVTQFDKEITRSWTPATEKPKNTVPIPEELQDPCPWGYGPHLPGFPVPQPPPGVTLPLPPLSDFEKKCKNNTPISFREDDLRDTPGARFFPPYRRVPNGGRRNPLDDEFPEI